MVRTNIALQAVRGLLQSALLFVALPLIAQDLSESNVKAAFIYNFLKFIELPGSSSEELKLCVSGQLHTTSIKELDGKEVKGSMIKVAEISKMADAKGCPVIFFSADSSLQGSLKELNGKGLLTIGEKPGFISSGGIVNFFIEESQVRFEISQERAKLENITISSQLLKLAKIVRDTDR